MENEVVEKKKKPASELKEITPLKDFVIKMNEFYYDLKKGKKAEVHKMFLVNLKTEKVIK